MAERQPEVRELQPIQIMGGMRGGGFEPKPERLPKYDAPSAEGGEPTEQNLQEENPTPDDSTQPGPSQQSLFSDEEEQPTNVSHLKPKSVTAPPPPPQK